MTEKRIEPVAVEEGATVSPYLLRPCRSYAQVLRDLKRRTAHELSVRSERAGAASVRTPQRS